MNNVFAKKLAGVLSSEKLTFLAWTGATAAAVTVLATLQGGADFAHKGQNVPWLGILLARTVNCFAYAIFVPLLWRLARRRPIGAAPWLATLALYLAVSLTIAVAKETIFVAIGNLFRPGVFVLGDILAEDYLDEVLTVWALIALAHAFEFHRLSARRRQSPEAEAAPAGEEFLTVQADGAVHRIPLRELEWAEAQGNYIQLSTVAGRLLIRETMNRLEARVGPAFVRVHRSHIVNADKVVRVEPRSHSEYWLVLASGARAPTSRHYKDEVRRRLMQAPEPACASSQAETGSSQPC